MARRLIVVPVLIALVAIAELIARYGLGLGMPPLYVADPLTEYRLKPSQWLRRFGNRIEVNRFSMRSSGPLEPQRTGRQRRVHVFGDSVMWGGSQLNQRLIATELLAQPGMHDSPTLGSWVQVYCAEHCGAWSVVQLDSPAESAPDLPET